MMTADAQPKVPGFGLAKETRTHDVADRTLTGVGHSEVSIVIGTPAYMSSKQIARRKAGPTTAVRWH